MQYPLDPLDPQDALAQAILKSLIDGICADAGLDLTFVMEPRRPGVNVTFEGPDVPMLLHRNAELLLAMEHLATQALRLTPEQHECISFDAGDFKRNRERALERSAAEAVRQVRESGKAFHFAPMSSRERRLLHLALAGSGLPTASEGEPPRRHLVLHPGR